MSETNPEDWAPSQVDPAYEEGGPGHVPTPTAPPATGAQWEPQQLPPAGYVPVDAIGEIVNQALARQAAGFEQKFEQLRREQEAERALQYQQTGAAGFMPEHSGGVGLVNQPTWSYYDQQLALAGKHPLQDREV